MSAITDTLDRYDVLNSMNTIVQSMNNEEAYMVWITVVPDAADRDDLMEIAEDDGLFAQAVNHFYEIWEEFSEDGLFVGGKEFGGYET